MLIANVNFLRLRESFCEEQEPTFPLKVSVNIIA